MFKSYGNGVDLFAEKLLPEFGYACDVGANNGEFLSNSLIFENKGWIVLCIEPNPLLDGAGRQRRKLWRSVAAGGSDTNATLYIHGLPPYASNTGMVQGSDKPTTVPMFRLDRLIEEAGFPRLDFLTVDVEGYEAEVMSGFDIERWRPKIISLESIYDDMQAPKGYERLARIEFDNVYGRRS